MKAPIKTMRVKAENRSGRGKVLRVHGGTVEVPSYGHIEADILPLTQAEIDEYREKHNLVITPRAKGRAGKEPADTAALEKAVTEAEAALAKAQKGDDLAAVASAQQALDDARRKLSEA